MSIRESGEMHLETILILSRSSSEVHSIDVADYMNVSKPSVSRAVGILKNAGYIVTGISPLPKCLEVSVSAKKMR